MTVSRSGKWRGSRVGNCRLHRLRFSGEPVTSV